MGYFKERIKHAIRFRNKRGYGVHSPFMFNLILNVIRDREKQFSYPEALERQDHFNHQEKKVFRLLSRLIRFLKVERIACLGCNAEKLVPYLEEIYHPDSITSNRTDGLDRCDFIYIGRKASGLLEENISFQPESVPFYLVIADIYRDPSNNRIWRKYREKATVSVDMMWYGLLFFDNKIQKGKYSLII